MVEFSAGADPITGFLGGLVGGMVGGRGREGAGAETDAAAAAALLRGAAASADNPEAALRAAIDGKERYRSTSFGRYNPKKIGCKYMDI